MVESTNTFSQQMHLPFFVGYIDIQQTLNVTQQQNNHFTLFFFFFTFFVCKFIRVTGLMNIQNSFEHVQTLDISQCHFVLT